MNCIIVDDEKMARAIVSKLCSTVPELTVLEEFDNAIEAIKYINKNAVDVVFLDIHMPGFSGVDFVQTIRDTTKVVLITSDTDFAIASYEYDTIVDYLVKPITADRFQKSIQKVKGALKSEPASAAQELETDNSSEDLFINIDRRLIKLDLRDIRYIEANGDYIDITTTARTYHVHTTLKKIKEKLPEKLFLQIHRSYIINFTMIVDIEDNSVLIDKKVIPISRSSRPELMLRLNLL
ncbi:LytR/AlgR family response regulator transcription factor [Maribacter chungangensis]|uniref:LytR/AlgR family response regulator transcription factor n=1 Tax=Maribacter chungangensis TaxID=1069117 RepID=A0ABW3B6A2_9FLAO